MIHNPVFHHWKKLIKMAELARVCYLVFVKLKRAQSLK